MNRHQFEARLTALVGRERGVIERGARLMGMTGATLRSVLRREGPVRPLYVRRLEAAEAQAVQAGAWFGRISPDLERVVRRVVREGCSERDAVACVAAWAALRLSGGR